MVAFSKRSLWTVKGHLPTLPQSPRRHHLLWSTLLTVVVVLVSFGITTSLILGGVDDRVPFTGSASQQSLLDGSVPQISLVGDFLAVDTDARTVTVDWYLLPANCSFTETVANIYVDPNSNGPDTQSSDPPSTPVFVFNSTKACKPSNHDSFNTFRTMFKLTGRASSGPLDRESLQAYPFDKYIFQISMYASLASTNESVAIILEKSFGVPVNFDISLDRAASHDDDQGIFLSFVASRSGAVRALVIIMMIANWLVTLAFLWITTASFIWEETLVTEMFILPIGALFAFTSVRANLPGAPTGFGAIVDYYGILPNLGLMTLFSAILLFRVLLARIDSRSLRMASPPVEHPKSDQEHQPLGMPDGKSLSEAIAEFTMVARELRAAAAGLENAAIQLTTVAQSPLPSTAAVEADSGSPAAPHTEVNPVEAGSASDSEVTAPPPNVVTNPETPAPSTTDSPAGASVSS